MEWAHITEGRIKYVDMWNWVQPDPNEAAQGICDVAHKTFSKLYDQNSRTGKIHGVISYDGNNWYSGACAQTETILNEKLSGNELQFMSHDTHGRGLYWAHGYVSNGGGNYQTFQF